MLKGYFAHHSLFGQILLLLIFIFSGMILFTGIGVALAAAIYSISPEEVLNTFAHLHEGGGREVFKLVQGLNTIGTYLIPGIIGALMFSKEPEGMIGVDSFPRPAWLILIALTAAAYSMGALSDLLYRMSTAFPWPESISANFTQIQEVMLGTYENILNIQGPVDFVQVLLVMAVLPAIAEETLFRGLIQPLLRRHLNPHLAILITSAVFSLLHQQYLAFLSIFVLGALLGYLREWSNSIWPSTILHFFNNASIVVLVYYFDYDYRQALSSDMGINWTETLVLLAILSVSILLLHNLFAKNRRWISSK